MKALQDFRRVGLEVEVNIETITRIVHVQACIKKYRHIHTYMKVVVDEEDRV